jgi:hypothetical protein
MTPPRVQFLNTAIALTAGDRDKDYGSPVENLRNIAVLWEAYIFAKYTYACVNGPEFEISAEDVAWLNVLQKMARTFHTPPKADTYIDAAAYAAIAGECAIARAPE